MINLILKDLKIAKKPLLGIFCWWVFFIYFANLLFSKGKNAFPFMIISLMLVFQSLLIDDKNKTENLYVSLPVKRSSIVSARYLSAYGMIAVVLFFSYFTILILNRLMPDVFTRILPLENIVGAQLMVIYFTAVMLPLFFRYGAHLEEGLKVIAFIILIFVVVVLGIAIYWEVNLFKSLDMFLCSIGAVLSSAVSWLWSLRIYRKREF